MVAINDDDDDDYKSNGNKQTKKTNPKKINAQKRHTNAHTHKISHQPIWLRPKKKKRLPFIYEVKRK